MVESGFFIHVFKWLADAVVGKIEDDLDENLSDFVRDKKEKAQIKQKLNETFERYFREQYEHLPLSEEFKILELHEWLVRNLYTKVVKCFIDDSPEASYKDSFIESSYAIAGADTKAKRASVKAYVQSFLNAFEFCYFKPEINNKDQYLINQQTEKIKILIQSKKEELQTDLHLEGEKIKRSIEYRGSFAEFIDKIELQPRKTQFHFLNPKIGFVRREAEFKLLDDFLEHEETLLSLVITGFGGIGKSKLLHHYILELQYNWEWKGVMLNQSHIDQLCRFSQWDYPKKLLLVIDDAAENSAIIGEWIRRVNDFNNSPNKKRLILLERQGLTMEIGRYPFWYTDMNDKSDNLLEESQFKPVRGFHELKQFDEKEMFQVMDMLPGTNSKLDDVTKEAIYKKIVSFSGDSQDKRFNTPLIALLLADAHINSKDIPDPEQLMLYVIERNKRSWKRFCANLKEGEDLLVSLERLIVYATAMGGCDLTELPSLLTNDRELLINTLKTTGINQLLALIAGDNQEHHRIEPLKPDVIGEYFVLDYINQNRYSDFCKEMVSVCWEKRGKFFSFLLRCTNSYLGAFPDLILDEQSILLRDAGHELQAITLLLTRYPNITFQEKSVEIIFNLYQKQKRNLPRLEVIFGDSLLTLLAEIGNTAIYRTDDQQKALNDRWLNKPEIALVYAKGLVGETVGQDEEDRAGKAVAILKALSNKFPGNSEIALQYAKSLVFFLAEQEEELASNTLNELKAFSSQWSTNPEIAIEYAKGLLFISNDQEEIAACKTIIDLKELSDYWSKNLEIDFQYAKALGRLSAKQRKNDLAYNPLDENKALIALLDKYGDLYQSDDGHMILFGYLMGEMGVLID